MPLVTFNPPIAPSPGTPFNPKIDIRRAEFGDGYTQASPRGTNHVRKAVTLRWDALTTAQLVALRTFFEAQLGTIPFLYSVRDQLVQETTPDEIAYEPALTQWVCREWKYSDAAPWNFEAKLEQDFSHS